MAKGVGWMASTRPRRRGRPVATRKGPGYTSATQRKRRERCRQAATAVSEKGILIPADHPRR